MTVTESQTIETIESTGERIIQLEIEISSRSADIQNLTAALETLQAGKPRPTNPQVDDTFSLLKQLLGDVPQNIKEKEIYSEKLAEAHRALQLATEVCQQKSNELKGLKQAHSLEQSDHLFGELLSKAEKFNAAIDLTFDLLGQMQTLNSEISRLRNDCLQVFEVTADLIETAYCQIGGSRVKVRRRFDIKREQQG